MKREALRFLSVALVLLTILSMFLGWVVPDDSAPVSRRMWAKMMIEDLVWEHTGSVDAIIPESELQGYYRGFERTGMGPYTFAFYYQKLIKHGLPYLEADVEMNPGTKGNYRSMILTIAGIVLAVFWLTILLLVSLVIRHILGKKGKGILALLLVWALFALFYFMTRTTELMLTPWGFVAGGSLFASVIVWGVLCGQQKGAPGPISARETDRCPRCGASYESGQMVCSGCGNYLE